MPKPVKPIFRFLLKNLPLMGLLLLAAGLRIPLLNGSFWLDEAAQALESARPLSQQLNIANDFQPPFLHVLLHFWMIFGKSEWWLRLAAALLPGLATVAAVYLVGCRWWNQKVGWWAALLLATSSFHIFYSQELRPYAWPAALAAASWLLLSELRWRQPSARQARWLLFGCVLLNTVGVYSSYLYPFVLIGQCLYLFFSGRKWWPLLAKMTAPVGLLFLPWLPLFVNQFQTGQQLRQDLPGWQAVVGFGPVKALLMIFGKFAFGPVDLQVNLPFLAVSLGLIGISGLAAWLMVSRSVLSRLNFWTLCCWGLLPLGLIWLVSWFVPILQPKRVLFLLPVWYLVLAAGLPLLAQRSTRPWLKNLPRVLLAAVVAINIWSVGQYWTQPALQREDWRGLQQRIVNSYPANQTIVAFAFDAPFAPWEWYDHGETAAVTTQALVTTKETDLSQLRQVVDYRYILAFDYLQDLTDPERRMIGEFSRYGFQQVDVIQSTTPLGQVRVFARPSTLMTGKFNP